LKAVASAADLCSCRLKPPPTGGLSIAFLAIAVLTEIVMELLIRKLLVIDLLGNGLSYRSISPIWPLTPLIEI
jgi:hypothetical protein